MKSDRNGSLLKIARRQEEQTRKLIQVAEGIQQALSSILERINDKIPTYCVPPPDPALERRRARAKWEEYELDSTYRLTKEVLCEELGISMRSLITYCKALNINLDSIDHDQRLDLIDEQQKRKERIKKNLPKKR